MLTVDIKKTLKTFTLELSFTMTNEVVVLFGPSGSGKTTTLQCLSGLTQPDQGLIDLNGRVLFSNRQKPVPVQKRGIGYVFQDYALFPHMTVKKNILYGAKNADEAMNIVDTLGIQHLLEVYPNNISGGEKQRVALARAFATEPSLLLLDEPFSSLDEQVKQECHRELLRLHQKWQIPVILVTHDYEEAEKLADRMIHINKGRSR
ncbi:ATP-binding cassette domain-containing protein [Halobacillus locisalis]|uniref:ATP-binding cassette domain-containing protein n=1 Tax=Halobacillus locisalis TaxID=220753 RepID=A0A838CRE9_9BACI|nr:ATP-binding cassette domain-containing protein [Halobacillus locisalis]MBA2174712.1 ATP-binding cassette domain-containing protein [Halobacillus locisalis]